MCNRLWLDFPLYCLFCHKIKDSFQITPNYPLATNIPQEFQIWALSYGVGALLMWIYAAYILKQDIVVQFQLEPSSLAFEAIQYRYFVNTIEDQPINDMMQCNVWHPWSKKPSVFDKNRHCCKQILILFIHSNPIQDFMIKIQSPPIVQFQLMICKGIHCHY